MGRHSYSRSLGDRFAQLIPHYEAADAHLYVELSRSAAWELRSHTRPFYGLLEPWQDESARYFLPKRLFAAVHYLVLTGQAPELAQFYPTVQHPLAALSVDLAWPVFLDTVLTHADQIQLLLEQPLQHNEVGRAGAISMVLQYIIAWPRGWRLPLRLCEVGTSAGLLLRSDLYTSQSWYPTLFEHGSPLPIELVVKERLGCDLFPVDIDDEDQVLRLKSYVWADLPLHMTMLMDGIKISQGCPAVIEQADGADWLPRVAKPQPGMVTVALTSLMQASGPEASLTRIYEAIYACGAMATNEAPFAWLQLDAPPGHVARRDASLSLTWWPGRHRELLVTCDVNGRHVRWVGL